MSSSNSEVLFSCTVASGLFASMLYLSFHPEKDDVLQAFMDTLNGKQKKLYIKIKNERAQIYFLGLIVSLLIGFIYLNNTRKSDTRTCVFVSMVLGITILFYLLYPKSTYMVRHLTSQKQTDAWLQVYRFMQYNHYLGMVLGGLAYLIVAIYM